MLSAPSVFGEAPPTLARFVPAEARFYIEVADWNRLVSSPVGALLAEAVQGLTESGSVRPGAAKLPQSRPASAPSTIKWRDQLASHIGLNQPAIIDLLASGRLAVAADGWQSLGDAILIAQPADVTRLESLLRAQLAPARPGTPASAPASIRSYRLTNDHELTCDGTTILIGRRSPVTGLYTRTLALWRSDHGVGLADTADFLGRVGMVPAQPQVLVYLTGRSRSGPGSALPPIAWPAEWNQYQSLAVTASISPVSITIDTFGFPRYQTTPVRPRPDLPLLGKLPSSTLLAWTQSIDYAAHYRRLTNLKGENTFSFYREVLESGLPPGSLDGQLLSHLVGDSLFVLSQVAKPSSRPGEASSVFWVPALTLAVQTDNSERLSATLLHSINNLVLLMNVKPPASGPLRIESTPIGPGGGTVLSVPVGQLLTGRAGSEILGQLQLSWTISDRLLVLGTASESVRELVLARRGQAPLLALAPPPSRESRASRTVLLAQPQLISELVASWASFLTANQTAFLRPDWWTQLQSVRTVSLNQLGAVHGKTGPGSVQIAHVVPELPAGSRLRSGDTIVGVDGHVLDSTDSLASLELSLATRPRREAVVLKVIRDGCEVLIEVPVPPPILPSRNIGPVDFLQQASRVLRLFATARYSVSTPTADTVATRVELQFSPVTMSRKAARP